MQIFVFKSKRCKTLDVRWGDPIYISQIMKQNHEQPRRIVFRKDSIGACVWSMWVYLGYLQTLYCRWDNPAAKANDKAQSGAKTRPKITNDVLLDVVAGSIL